MQKDTILAIRIKRVQDYIIDKVKRNGEMSYYDEDVMYIIQELSERLVDLKGIEAEHKKINGQLRKEIKLLESENNDVRE